MRMSILTSFKHLSVIKLSAISWSPLVVKGLLLFIYMWNLWRRYLKERKRFCFDDSIIWTSEEKKKKIFFRAAYTEKRWNFCVVFEGLNALASFLKSLPFRPNEFLSSSYWAIPIFFTPFQKESLQPSLSSSWAEDSLFSCGSDSVYT